MKIKIPNYVNWFGPYHLFEPAEKLLIKLGAHEDDAYDIVHAIVKHIPEKPFRVFHDFRKNLPWNKHVIEIDKWDTWSMDGTLAPIIIPMLKQLKETKHGVPYDFAHVGGESWDSQLSFDWYEADVDKLFDEHAERRWNEVMDKMIWSFEEIAKSSESEGFSEDYWEPMTEEEIIATMEKHNSVYKDILAKPSYKINREKLDAYNERMQEGLELFGKYFRNLWD